MKEKAPERNLKVKANRDNSSILEIDENIARLSRQNSLYSQSCFDLKNPKSFFLFAGAGSGKTRSLVSALEYIINTKMGRELKFNGRNVAVITYKNAARDEIKRRSRYNPLFEISTIHSFAWNLICPHTCDIREWLKREIGVEIANAEKKLATSRKTMKTYQDAEKKLAKLTQRLEYLDSVKHFIYNPDGLNVENNSLDHSEVIKITAEFLSQKETLQKILVDKYPILLIDESQDTKKDLMNVILQMRDCKRG